MLKGENMAKPIDNKDDKNPNNKKQIDSNTAMLINNVVIIIVIIVSMIIMYVLLDSSMDKKLSKIVSSEEQLDETDEDNAAKEEGILLDLGDFILNLADVDKRRYLKVGLAIELTKTQAEIEAGAAPQAKPSGHGESAAADPNAAIATEMERYKPAIRDAVISILSNKTSDELSTPTGKEIAKEEILEMVNGIFEGQRSVQRISFGQFIIQ